MKIKAIGKSLLSEWGRKVFSFGVFIILMVFQETIQAVPFFNEVSFFLLMIVIFYFLKQIHLENKKIKSGDRVRIRRQIDTLNTLLLLLFGVLIIGFAAYRIDEVSILGKVNYTIVGLLLIISGIINRKSLVLEKVDNSNIGVVASGIKIQSTDKALTFSKFQIVLKKENGQIERLKDLVLNLNAAKQISNWLNTGLTNSSLDYYWQIENKIEKIDTDHNNV